VQSALDEDHKRSLEVASSRRRRLQRSPFWAVRWPARNPNLNAYAERFVRSAHDEWLANIIPLSETHLREVLREYVAPYHAEAIIKALRTSSSIHLTLRGRGASSATAGSAAC
jgi:hypothetical protein